MLGIEVAAYCAIGALAGVMAGLLGLGGGIVTVPCLLIAFRLLGFPQVDWMHLAIGTSLAAMILNTLSATWAHHRRKAVMWQVVRKMTPGFVLGSIAGAWVATSLSGVLLEIIFGSFLCILGVYFLRGKVKVHPQCQLPSWLRMNTASAGIGAISNILGIGGGTMTVPLLSHYKMSDKAAIGTSAACSLLLTVLGASCYLLLGLGSSTDSESVGYINLTAFLIVGGVSFFFAPYGVKLSHDLPAEKVRKIFAYVVIVTGLLMLFN